MQSLEFVIKNNIEPLITWAARKEFTAENMVFLREVRNFRQRWGVGDGKTSPSPYSSRSEKQCEAGSTSTSTGTTLFTTVQRKQQYAEASLIFFTLINPFTAETPINIEYKVFRALQSLFSGVLFDPYECDASSERSARDNVVCPWEDEIDKLERADSMKSDEVEGSVDVNRVPAEFGTDCFDAAFESIKYLVFTNTWPRYVEAEQAAGAMGGKWVEG
jgi:hypothetical protein